MDRIYLVPHVDGELHDELGCFRYGPFGLGGAEYSRDRGALFIPTLRLAPRVIRNIAAGGTLVEALRGVSLLACRGAKARYNRSSWSYVWGDLMVFETGEPVVRRAILVRGKVDVPDIGAVSRYLAEMPKPS